MAFAAATTMQPKFPIYLFAPADDGHLLVAWSIDDVGREVEPWYAENYVGFDVDARPVSVLNERNIVVVRVAGEPDMDGLRRAIREWGSTHGVKLPDDDSLLIAARERYLLNQQARWQGAFSKRIRSGILWCIALLGLILLVAIFGRMF